jgi:hypothetical protein
MVTTDARCIDFAAQPRLSAVDRNGDTFVIE